jgi:hypothetical protein
MNRPVAICVMTNKSGLDAVPPCFCFSNQPFEVFDFCTFLESVVNRIRPEKLGIFICTMMAKKF